VNFIGEWTKKESEVKGGEGRGGEKGVQGREAGDWRETKRWETGRFAPLNPVKLSPFSLLRLITVICAVGETTSASVYIYIYIYI